MPPSAVVSDEDLSAAQTRMSSAVMDATSGMDARSTSDFDAVVEADVPVPSEGAPVSEPTAKKEDDSAVAMAQLEKELVGTEIPVAAGATETPPPPNKGAGSLAEALDGDPLFNEVIQRRIRTEMQQTERLSGGDSRDKALDGLIRNSLQSELGGFQTGRSPLRHGQGVG